MEKPKSMSSREHSGKLAIGQNNLANGITLSRIGYSIAMLFCPVFSVPFYVLYVLSGISDMLDGPIARKTNTVTDKGAIVDAAADAIFTAAVLYKLLPVLDLSIWIYLWIGGIAIMKLSGILFALSKHKRNITVHSALNKAAGVVLYTMPLTSSVADMRSGILFACSLATLAAVRESITLFGKP